MGNGIVQLICMDESPRREWVKNLNPEFILYGSMFVWGLTTILTGQLKLSVSFPKRLIAHAFASVCVIASYSSFNVFNMSFHLYFYVSYIVFLIFPRNFYVHNYILIM